MTKKVIDNTFEVLAIQMMTVLQAIDFLDCQEKLSPVTLRIYHEIRKIFPVFIEDTPKYKDLNRIKKYFEQSDPVITGKTGSLAENVPVSLNGL
jgi:histidine ammonia-lyase